MEGSLRLPARCPGLRRRPGGPLSAPLWSAGAPRTHPERGRLLPEDAAVCVWRGGRLFLHPPRTRAAPPPPQRHRASGSSRRGGGAVRTCLGQWAPSAPCPKGRHGESLLLRISALCLGSPASGRRREPSSGRQEGAGREPEPESQSVASQAGWGHSPETDPLTAGRKGSLPRAQSSKTSTLHRIFPARKNSRQSLLGKLRPEVWAPEGS